MASRWLRYLSSAFGLAAARINGRYEHAYPLAAQMIAATWTLPNGRMAMPALLSNYTDAPFLGEQCILYCLTRRPHPGVSSTSGGRLPLIVLLILFAYVACAAALSIRTLLVVRGAALHPPRYPRLQALGWTVTLTTCAILLYLELTVPLLIGLSVWFAFPITLWRRR